MRKKKYEVTFVNGKIEMMTLGELSEMESNKMIPHDKLMSLLSFETVAIGNALVKRLYK